MLTHEYSYATCLEGSIKSAWTVEDCYQGRDFDFAKPFLPERMAGVAGITCLNDDEQRWLNQIRGNSYCHLFAFVEEYIVPMVMASAAHDVYGDETRLWSLVRFAEEEIKHQQLMRRACDQFAAGFGAPCGLIPGREAVAEVVLGRSELTALLLTSMIEWFTQLHYVEHVRDAHEPRPALPRPPQVPLDRRIAPRPPRLAADRRGRPAIDTGRARASDRRAARAGRRDRRPPRAADRARHRVAGTSAPDEPSPTHEKSEIRTAQQRSYRWTFLVSGLEHPKFIEIVSELTDTGHAKIAAAAAALSV